MFKVITVCTLPASILLIPCTHKIKIMRQYVHTYTYIIILAYLRHYPVKSYHYTLYRLSSFTCCHPVPVVSLYQLSPFTSCHPLPVVTLYQLSPFTSCHPLPVVTLYQLLSFTCWYCTASSSLFFLASAMSLSFFHLSLSWSNL